jgi:hypothetical protein
LEFAAFDKDKSVDSDAYPDVVATFDDDSLSASYAKSAHAGIPERGSLLVNLDDHAWEYLDYPIDTGWKQPFCECVYQSDASKEELRRLEKRPLAPLFTEGTMLAAIQRSIELGPRGSGLHELLAKSAADFADSVRVDLRKATEKRMAEAELLQQGLTRLKGLRKKITGSYR